MFIEWFSEHDILQVKIDAKRSFKRLFVTNAFDGSEDYLVSDKLFKLIGPQMIQFREELMKEKSTKDLEVLLKSITPPKGIRRKNVEGAELLDCEGEEIEESVENEVVSDDEGMLMFDISKEYWYKLVI